MPRRYLGTNVFDEAVDRMVRVYEAGHRVVVSFSAGKDSGACLEIAILAATLTDRLPVEVALRDEEIMLPGTYEYAERVVARPEVKFSWLIAGQPIINIFDRTNPYWWVFDRRLQPEEWVRQPPAYAEWIKEQDIERFSSVERFPPAPGKQLMVVIGLRGQESSRRMMGLHSSGGYLTRPTPTGIIKCRPIYDWTDGDIWKAHADNAWDYNRAYDVMSRMGISRKDLRIAPPTMSAAGVKALSVAARAWPGWFDKVATRLPGVRTVAQFGLASVQPRRDYGESWQQTFERECVNEAAADWIRERSVALRDAYLRQHRHHASTPFPEIAVCSNCTGSIGSWRKLTQIMYTGDPFSLKTQSDLPYMEPEFFREGAGTWGGSPAW